MVQKRRKSQNATPKYKWIGHVEVYFNDDERDAAIKYLEERTQDSVAAIDTIVQGECAIKFSYDDSKDCYRVTLQPKAKHCYLYGYTLGLNHVDFDRLAGLALYTVTVLLENGGIEKPSDKVVNDF